MSNAYSPEEMENLFSVQIAQKLSRALEQRQRPRTSVSRPIPERPNKPFGPGFLKCGQIPPKVDVAITPGTTLRCVGGFVDTPTSFYVMPYETYDELETFQSRLHQFVQHLDTARSTARPTEIADLLPGLYVYAEVQKVQLVDSELEWHRAKIIYNPFYCKKKLLDIRSDELKVRLVDFGDTRIVHLKHILFMSNTFGMEFPIQAIRCEIGFVDEHYANCMSELTRIPNLKWSKQSVHKIVDLLEYKNLAVNFLSCYVPESDDNDPFDPAAEVCWAVSVNIIVSETTEFPDGKDPVAIEPTLEKHPSGDFGIACLNPNVSEHFKEDIDKLIADYNIKLD